MVQSYTLNNYLANLLNISILWLGDLFSTVHFQFLLNSTVLNSLDNSLHIHLNYTIRRKCDQLDNCVLKNSFVGHAYIVFFSHIAVLLVENRPRWFRTTWAPPLHFMCNLVSARFLENIKMKSNLLFNNLYTLSNSKQKKSFILTGLKKNYINIRKSPISHDTEALVTWSNEVRIP